MPSDWTNFKPSKIPKGSSTTENIEISVPPDIEISGDPTEITMGPKKVFKTGYPTGKSVDTAGGPLEATNGHQENRGGVMNVRPLVASRETSLLSVHGVADASGVKEILHPKDLSVLQSVIRQEAFIVTSEYKVINIAANEWPINLEAAQDARSVLTTPVRYGDQIGIVSRVEGEVVYLKVQQSEEDIPVAMQDLDPVMDNSEPEEEA